MFCLYKLTFPNGKYYFGIASDFKRRMRSHKHKEKEVKVSPLHSAIKKYTWDAVKTDVLRENLTPEEAYELEIKHIAEYKTNDLNCGYNLDAGGRTRLGSKNRNPLPYKGKCLSEAHRLNLIAAKSGKDYSEISSKNATKYKILVEDTITKTSETYRNVSCFCKTFKVKPATVYNHIRRKSNLLNKKWKIRYE